ncbi:MAG: hypothetical protein OEQ13_13475 [Acidobacteriota bacterium]|nr:hypothetical protein [Acidobacteriota bacterium]
MFTVVDALTEVLGSEELQRRDAREEPRSVAALELGKARAGDARGRRGR